jgi:hypothetical protein
MFLEAVLNLARAGIHWRDMPKEYWGLARNLQPVSLVAKKRLV